MAATAIKGRKPRSCSMCKKEMTSNKALERNALGLPLNTKD
jgi:hypothetical protein